MSDRKAVVKNADMSGEMLALLLKGGERDEERLFFQGFRPLTQAAREG